MILNFQVNQFQENHILAAYRQFIYRIRHDSKFLETPCQLVFRDADINICIESDGSLFLENKFYLLHTGWVRDLPV